MATSLAYRFAVAGRELPVVQASEPKWFTEQENWWGPAVWEEGRSQWHQIDLLQGETEYQAWLRRLERWIKSAPPAPVLPPEALRRENLY